MPLIARNSGYPVLWACLHAFAVTGKQQISAVREWVIEVIYS